MEAYAGIDLHGNNLVLAVVDQKDRLLRKDRLALDLDQVLRSLEPFREALAGVAVESTYNWYWLVDGLMDAGYETKLVNTAAVPQYAGLKHVGDADDARWLAKLQHLGLLPTGWICPKEVRSTRDLLRKRGRLVQQRTAQLLSIQSQYARCLGWRIRGDAVWELTPETIFDHFEDELQGLATLANWEVLTRLNDQIRMLERVLEPRLRDDEAYQVLTTMPGVGRILGMTIALETGQIERFRTVGNYASYCRCVPSGRYSNKKKKGEGNRKNGNKHLAWAWQEAASFARRHHEPARRWHQRKAAKSQAFVAWKALAHKLCRAGYFMMRDQVEFSSALLFG